MTIEAADVESALLANLPAEKRALVGRLARLVTEVVGGALSLEVAQARIGTDAELASLVQGLVGKRIHAKGAVLDFGQNNRFGTVTIGDVAGGDLVKLSFLMQRFAPGIPFQAPPLPGHFVPRPKASQAARSRLLAEGVAGTPVVCALHGLGGVGKSTLVSALAQDPEVRQRFPDGVLWATLGQQPDVLSWLSLWVQALGDYDFKTLAMGVEPTSAHLRSLLRERATLLVVDDAWDAAHALPFLVGGPRSRMLLTTRRASVADELGAELVELDVLTPEQSTDLLASRLGRALEPAERARARSVAEAVGFLPLALELAAVRVSRGMIWADLEQALKAEVARLEALEDPGRQRMGRARLQASLNLSLLALRGTDPAAYEAFIWLGVLPEDARVCAPMAATLWSVATGVAEELTRLLWGESLLLQAPPVRVGSREWPAFRIHDLLHDLARRLLGAPIKPGVPDQLHGLGMTLEAAGASLLDRYRKQLRGGLWHTLPDDGYIHAHLVWHLTQAGSPEKVHDLLREETPDGKNGWYETRERLGQISGFMLDVARARALARSESNHSRWLGQQIRYTLVASSLNSLAAAIPPPLLCQLVESHVWSLDQGLAYARRVVGLKRRADMLGALLSFAGKSDAEVIAHEAVEAARAIDQEHSRSEALLTLVPHLPEAALRRATEAARAFGPYYRSKGLTAVAPRLSVDERAGVLREALEAVRDIDDEQLRLQALLMLVSHLPEAELRKALEVARAFDSQSCRSKALSALALRLPGRQRTGFLRRALAALTRQSFGGERAGVLREALETARAIHDKSSRSDALAALAPQLPEGERAGVLREALETARAEVYESSRRVALSELAPQLPENLLPQALETARGIHVNPAERSQALSALAPYLPEGERAGVLREALQAASASGPFGPIPVSDRSKALSALAPHLPATLLPQALAAMEAIDYESDRSKALVALAPRLTGDLLRRALAVGRAINDRSSRSDALAALALQLPEDERAGVLREALEVVRAIGDESSCSDVLVALAPQMPEGERAGVLREALAAARAVAYQAPRAEALAALAPKLPEGERAKVLCEALEIALETDGTYTRPHLLALLAPHLLEDLLPQVLDMVVDLPLEVARSKVLAALAPRLPESLLPRALAVAKAIDADSSRSLALAALAPRLPEDKRVGILREALTAAQGYGSGSDGMRALALLAPQLPEDLLPEALAAAPRGVDSPKGWMVLVALAPRLPEHLIPEAVAVARAMGRTDNRSRALAALAQRLPETERIVLQREALEAARDSRSEQFPLGALASLVPHLPDELLPQALEIARATGDESDRSAALAALAPRLPENLLPQALEIARSINGANQRIPAIVALERRPLEHDTPGPNERFWDRLLPELAVTSRRVTLNSLSTCGDLIGAFGGPEAVGGTCCAIRDVGRWWP